MPDSADLLVEIGTEELPPKALRELRDAFQEHFLQGLTEADLSGTASSTYATPRRLAIRVDGVPMRQPDQAIERRGPAVAAAFDEDGEPTRAATGFARSCGVDVGALETMETDKGRWLVYRGVREGRPATELLPGIVETSLARLPIPRRMRWGQGQGAFVRPVHWILALLGDAVVDMEFFGIRSGNTTRGHRFHAPNPLTVARPSDYETVLEESGYVVPDLERRRDRVARLAQSAAESAGGRVVVDAELLDEVTALVEWPVALVGSFESRFLDVPAEALVSSMQGHQKYFPLRDNNGALLPYFVAIANLESRDPGEVRRGNERVIRPRLADAEFFWQQDRKRPLEARTEDLNRIVFQKRLGTLHAKQERVAALAETIAADLGVDPGLGGRAARLAKCDLTTQMVDEFPELQGVMGRHYALADGEDPALAAAMEEQYQPRFGGDDVPPSTLGQVLSIADRVDTLAGIFAIGQAPSGDKDPFALRRAALGLGRTLIEGERNLSLGRLFEHAQSLLPGELGQELDREAVIRFCLERLRGYFQDDGFITELFDAVFATGCDRPLDFARRVRACAGFLELDAAQALAAANKRVSNILRKSGAEAHGEIDPEYFEHPEERALYEAIEPLLAEVADYSARGAYQEALEALARVREPVDNFFEAVMVMAEDAALRRNRLALLDRLSRLFGQVADLSRLPGA